MDDIINMLLIMASNTVIVVAFCLLVANWVTKGLFIKYLRVFASRGSLILVEVKTQINNYFVIGKVIDGYLICKDKSCDKNNKRIPLKDNVIERWIGINKIKYDEKTNNFISDKGDSVNSWDAVMMEDLHERALKSPKDKSDAKLMMIIVLIAILTLLVSVLIAYQVFSIKDLVKAIPVATATVI